jgi:hypothetical protein
LGLPSREGPPWSCCWALRPSSSLLGRML